MDALVQQKFTSYPQHVAELLHKVRQLIFAVAKEQGVTEITETLKWGEPSYSCNKGSAIRFDWKAKDPEQYCIYFNCNTRLIDTFKEVYGDTFTYAGNRALVFTLKQSIPNKELAHCLSMALCYKTLKNQRLLGA